MTIVILIICGIALGVVFAGWWIERHAPEGYEDSTGFHYGRQK